MTNILKDGNIPWALSKLHNQEGGGIKSPE